MSRTARLFVAFAALLMLPAFALPLWRISLIAPQYPEGLGMLIRISDVTGAKEGDLQSINGLNHYIGMKVIQPDAIPELRFMPWILGALIMSALLVALLGNKKVFIGWAVAFAAVLAAGLADYWKWGYDYGHDLNPDAIIKIPGMTYQPPLIGSKQLLNFVATSWPAPGGWLLVAASVLVAVALTRTARPARRHARKLALAIVLLATIALAPRAAAQARDIIVNPSGPVRTITAALAAARPGDRILIDSGAYREPTLEVRTPRVTLQGRGWPVLNGAGARSVLLILADSVTVRGLVVANTGVANMEDRAGIRVQDADDCLIDGNRLRDDHFGIYLQNAAGCTVRRNDISAHGLSQSSSGNGIHLWYSPYARIEWNHIDGQRDGIYFEFSQHGVTRWNVSEHSQRYGLHFMFSDSCRYEHNTFRDNNSGVAVMYSRGIVMHANRFENSVGGASYGLLLKEILGGEISNNVFSLNSTAIYVEGSSHLEIRANDFLQNGWAVRLLGNAEDDRFTSNRFAGNAFDVSTNSTTTTSTFDGNWWDAYRGYDLDRDGTGNVPFYPVRLFALVVEQHPPSLALLRSPVVGMLNAAERALPVLTPAAIVDRHPLMHSPRVDP